MPFSAKLKQLRQQRGLSQKEAAKLIGVHFQQYGRYERGESEPSIDVLLRVANALEVSTDSLVYDGPDRAKDSIADIELIERFEKVAPLPKEAKDFVKFFLDAVIFKYQVSRMMQPSAQADKTTPAGLRKVAGKR